MQDFRETIVNITKNVTKTSGDLLKTTKLGISLSSEETNLKNLYIEIGKKVHEIYQYGGSLGKFFDEKHKELEACERKISEFKEQISQIKGTRECNKCGKTVERTSEYCPKCGMRVTDALPPSETATIPSVPPPIPSTVSINEPAPTTAVPVPQTISVPEPVPQTISVPEPVPQTRVCRVCGVANQLSSKFCLSCGRILE